MQSFKFKLVFQLNNANSIIVYVEFSPGENFLFCIDGCVEDMMMTFIALAKFKASAIQSWASKFLSRVSFAVDMKCWPNYKNSRKILIKTL